MDITEAVNKIIGTAPDEEFTLTGVDHVTNLQNDQVNFSWDWCMALETGDEKHQIKLNKTKYHQNEAYAAQIAETVFKLTKAGLKTLCFKSSDEKLVFVLIGATEKRLAIEADRVGYDLKLVPEEINRQGEALGTNLVHISKGSRIEIFENSYGKFRLAKKDGPNPEMWKLYQHYNTDEDKQAIADNTRDIKYAFEQQHPNSFFRAVDRIKLTMMIVEAEDIVKGAGLSPGKNIKSSKHPMSGMFPLQQEQRLNHLKDGWFKWNSMFIQPLDEVRDYFGESVAMYFGYLAFYCRWLILPTIVGFIVFIMMMIESGEKWGFTYKDFNVTVGGDIEYYWKVVRELGANDTGFIDPNWVLDSRFTLTVVDTFPPLLLFFSFFMSIWATVFVEAWKRQQARYRVRWGMENFLETEQPRPDFHGNWEFSDINGKLEEVFPWYQKIFRMTISQTVVWTLALSVIVSVAGIFWLKSGWPAAYLPLGSIINGIQITIWNILYGKISSKLNDYENHRTDTEYENNQITKSFLFKFVNSYNSLIIIAFIKRILPPGNSLQCLPPSCLHELQLQLFIIFLTQIIVNNGLEIGMPAFAKWRAQREKAKKGEIAEEQQKKTEIEKEYLMQQYEGTFDDFDEMIVQFGYVTLFVAAMPLTPLLAMANNFIEVKLDATKLCQFTRRPEPRGCENIGTWESIISLLGVIAVITNVALMSFMTNQLSFLGLVDKVSVDERVIPPTIDANVLLGFIVLEHVILGIKLLIAFLIPDEPGDVKDIVERNKYVVQVLIDGMNDDLEEEPETDVSTGTKQKTEKYDEHLQKFLNDAPSHFKVISDLPLNKSRDRHDSSAVLTQDAV